MLAADLELALELADLADAITLPRFRAADLVVTTKPDLTPVSDADRAAEEEIRRCLAADRPDDGVLGEEFGEPIRVSQVADLADAHLSYPAIVEFEAHGLLEAVLGVERRCWRARGYGDFWSHVLVAEGGFDVAFEPEVAEWDVAPMLVIVEEAGGRFTDLAGRRTVAGGSALSTNGVLHEHVLAILGEQAAAR